MLLKFFQRYHCDGRQQYFAKKIHTQMCITSLFGKVIDNENQHRKVIHEWNDDDDEQKKIFYEEERNKSLLEKSNQQSKNNKCVEKKPDKPETYIIYYEGGVGKISR
jgi:DNA gyrase/topoisomerase IV subunit B